MSHLFSQSEGVRASIRLIQIFFFFCCWWVQTTEHDHRVALIKLAKAKRNMVMFENKRRIFNS